MKKLLLLLLALPLLVAGCDDDKEPVNTGQGDILQNVSFPDGIFSPGARVDVSCTGFEPGLNLFSDKSGEQGNLSVAEHNNSGFSFFIPEDYTDGRYEIFVSNTSIQQYIGSLNVLSGGTSKVPKVGEFAFANIADAKTLYIISNNRASSRADEPDYAEPEQVMYKITEAGKEERVEFEDEDGEEVNTIDVKVVRNMSEKYVYVIYETITGFDHTEYIENEDRYVYLGPQYTTIQAVVRKSDGVAFGVPQEVTDQLGYLIDETTVFQNDYFDNVYFICGAIIYKIYNHGDRIEIQAINRPDMGISNDWVVDARGNVFISDEYIRLVSGEYTVPGPVFEPWYKPRVFVCYNDSEGFYYYNTYTVDETPRPGGGTDYNGYIDVKYTQPSSPATEWVDQFRLFDGVDVLWPGNDVHAFAYKDRTLLMVYPGSTEYEWYKTYKVTITGKGEHTEEELPAYDWPENITFRLYDRTYPFDGKYLYGSNNKEIWRLEIETGFPEVLYEYNKEFKLYSFWVSHDIVTFHAMELRTGDDIYGEILPDKTMNIIRNEAGNDIIFLERLN